MASSLRRLALALTVPALLATACGEAAKDTSAQSADELNYRSTTGQEFLLSTEIVFTLPESVKGQAGDALNEALLAHTHELRNKVTTAITAELDRIWPEDTRIRRSAGVTLQFRQLTAGTSEVERFDGDHYRMVVNGEFAGVSDLEAKLPLAGPDGEKYLPVKADLGAGEEELRVRISTIESSLNAYPKYLELFEDGLDIGAHFGGDHNTPEMDIPHAKSLYDDLVRSGFRSPVANFEALEIDSGPLERSIQVQGKEVSVRVRIAHLGMTTPETRDVLIAAYHDSMKNADIVIYDGHAGRRLDYSGVVLAYAPTRVSIPASEFKNIETTARQQVYLFNGCETYSGYADKLLENPNRNVENTDIITTANFSAIQPGANQVIAFIHSFIDEKRSEASSGVDPSWVPRSWDSVLGKMNEVGDRSWVHVYGVHGIDDNPRVSPLADVKRAGEACERDLDCGAADSRCVAESSERSVCGVACADSKGCPDGTKCVLPKGKSAVDDMQCLAF